MNKAAIRIEVLDLQDKHCRRCRKRYEMEHCWKKCEIGKRMNALGIYLGGQKPQIKKKIRTTEEWDKLCVEAIAMREKGMKFVEIAKILRVGEGSQISFQLRKRGLIN